MSLAFGLQELQASQRRAKHAFDQVGIFLDLVFVDAETGDRIDDDFGCVAEQAVAACFRAEHWSAVASSFLCDVFLTAAIRAGVAPIASSWYSPFFSPKCCKCFSVRIAWVLPKELTANTFPSEIVRRD